MSISRRLFLTSATPAVAVGALVAVPPVVEAVTPAEMTAIPTEVYEAIKRWQEAHRKSVRATRLFQDLWNTEDRSRLHREMVTAAQEMGPAREAMIFALWRVS